MTQIVGYLGINKLVMKFGLPGETKTMFISYFLTNTNLYEIQLLVIPCNISILKPVRQEQIYLKISVFFLKALNP